MSLYGGDWTQLPKDECVEPSVRVMVVRATDYERMQDEIATLRRLAPQVEP